MSLSLRSIRSRGVSSSCNLACGLADRGGASCRFSLPNRISNHSFEAIKCTTLHGYHQSRISTAVSSRDRTTLRAMAPSGIEESSASTKANWEVDSRGVERLAYQHDGWNAWMWRGHRINWVSAGDKGPIVLLIHGFGASIYHYRYTFPNLSKECRVYGLDCLGFGWSDKALVDYEGYDIWREQIADFIREVIHSNLDHGEDPSDSKVVLVGNSLGGYNSMAVAAQHPELVKGVVLLNAAGRFDESATQAPAQPAAEVASAASQSPLRRLIRAASEMVKRSVVGATFYYTKQPTRVRQVLRQVYANEANIDEQLVASILRPAQDPSAREVFYRVITSRGTPVNLLLQKMERHSMPLFLLWGAKDPWCVPARADQIESAYSLADRVDIESGHCPHDDTPELVNEAIIKWLKKL